MPDPITLQEDFSGGMKWDLVRLPPNALRNVINCVPDFQGAPLAMRNPQRYVASGSAVPAASSGSAIVAGVYSPFLGVAGSPQIFFDNVGHLFRYDGASVSSSSATQGSVSELAFYDNKVVIAFSNGTSAAKAISSDYSVIALSAAPAGKFVAVYKDIILLAGATATPDRIYFSDPGDVTSWDLVDGWWDVSQPITGLAVMKNAILVFMKDGFARIRGSVAPPGSDFAGDDPLFPIGCTDHKSICYWNDRVLFANGQGIYMTDGSAVQDITKECDQKTWWSFLMGQISYDPAQHTISCGVFQDYLVYNVSATTGSSSTLDSGMIDLRKFSWFRHELAQARCMWSAPYPEELYIGAATTNRAMKFSPVIDPSSYSINAFSQGGALDFYDQAADTARYQPYLRTGFFDIGKGSLSVLQFLFLTFTCFAGTDPTGDTSAYVPMEYRLSFLSTGNAGDSASMTDGANDSPFTSLNSSDGGNFDLGLTWQPTRKHVKINRSFREVAFAIASPHGEALYHWALYRIEVSANKKAAFK